MKHPRLFVLLFAAAAALAQMTPDQRRADFEQLAAFVNRAYAPLEWKRALFGFDALDARPWLERAAAARDDLDYYEICAEYVASLRDLHAGFSIPSDFVAAAPLVAGLYDGKPLIESVSRSALPLSRYPFEPGDELISVDGQAVGEWVDRAAKLQSFADERATRRWALDQIFFRVQEALPRAHQIGATARIAVRRRATGALETYDIPWFKQGTPFPGTGPLPPVRAAALAAAPPLRGRALLRDRSVPRYKRLRGFGSLAPSFALPAGFVQRFGRGGSDLVFSGTFQAEGFTIGFLRLPAFPSEPHLGALMLRQIDGEVQYFRGAVDGLVIDVMRNPGGDVCLTNDILTRFIPYPFRTVGDEFRPTIEIVQAFRDMLADAIDEGAGRQEIAALRSFAEEVERAYFSLRGRTAPLPVCGISLDLQPLTDGGGHVIAFGGPMLTLIDEFSVSSADVFPAVLQDAWRSLMFGRRTPGGGGLSTFRPAGHYGEAWASMTITMGVRPRTPDVAGIPPSRFIENIGAWPDIEADIMTGENLLTGGRPFVQGFTAAIVEHIRRARGD
jgi:hypothetical protein